MTPDPDTPYISTEAAADASGGPLPTLKTWIARGDIVLMGDEAPGTGRARRFSLRRVMHLALMVRLARAGASPSAASMAAAKWSDIGKWTERNGLERTPTGLFSKGHTYFIARIARDGTVAHAEVTNSDSLFQAFTQAHGDVICAVHLNALTIEVLKKLLIIR